MCGVTVRLFRTERHKVSLIRSIRQFCFNIRLSPAQQERLDALVELLQIPIAGRPSALIQFIELAVEAKQRPENRGIEKGHQRMNIVDAIFDRSAGKDEGIAALQPLDRLGRLGAPVLDALRFIQDDDIRLEMLVDVERIRQHLFVIDDGEKGSGGIQPQPLSPRAVYQLIGQVRETLDLFFPLGFQRSRSNNQRARRFAQAVQECARGNGLNRLAQSHFISQQSPLAESQVPHAFALIGI